MFRVQHCRRRAPADDDAGQTNTPDQTARREEVLFSAFLILQKTFLYLAFRISHAQKP
jgi:hypothetical protein